MEARDDAAERRALSERLPLDQFRRGIAIVENPLEVDVTEPACRLTGDLRQPLPVLLAIDVRLAVRFQNIAAGDEDCSRTRECGCRGGRPGRSETARRTKPRRGDPPGYPPGTDRSGSLGR